MRQAACLLALSAALAFASPALAHQDPAPVRVVVSPQADGVRLSYRLPAPVDRFDFADTDVIRGAWRVTTPGLALADGAITGDRPFDAFEIVAAPDVEEADRVYMALSRAGSGYVVYGPGLKARDQVTDLSFDLPSEATGLPADHAIDGYAYLGPRTAVASDNQADVVAGSNVPAELADIVGGAFFDALAYYGRELAHPLPFRPAVIASVDSPGPAVFRGDVTDTGVISVRFEGDSWRGARDDVAPFLWHEAFHLWNGHAVEARDSTTAPWLHEGGAEYAATVGPVSTGVLSQEQGLARIAPRLNGCRRALGSRDYDPTRLAGGSAPYDCGVVIQWIADLEMRRAGQGDVFTLWRDMLAGAAATPDGFGVSDFQARLVPESGALALLQGPGATRWASVQSHLADLGVTLENRPRDADYMRAAMFHVVSNVCKGGYGFTSTPEGLVLDDGDCGALSGAPTVVSMEEAELNTAGHAAFQAVQARCAGALPIRVGTRDGRTLETPCDKPLIEPVVWAVASAPPLRLAR